MIEGMMNWVCGATFALGIVGLYIGREMANSAAKELEAASDFYRRAAEERTRRTPPASTKGAT